MMTIKPLSYLFLLPFCAGVVGCQVHVTFAPWGNTDSQYAQKEAKAKQLNESSFVQKNKKKKSRFDFFNFDRNKQKLVDTKPLENFLATKVQQKTLKPNSTEQIAVTLSRQPIKHQEKIKTIKQDHIMLVNQEVIVPPTPATPTDQSFPTGDAASSSIEDAPFGATTYPIDLPTTLRLAGADNWNVKLALEQINEAYAQHEKAKVMWVPTLNVGIGYTKHDGQIQATNGQVVDVSRNSLFVGGGAVSANNPPLTGGAGGPARLGVDLSLTDAIFEPLAERQLYNASRSQHSTAFNNALLEASLGYYSLMKAQGSLAIAKNNLQDAQVLHTMTVSFVKAGKGSRADVSRAAVEVSRRQQAIVMAQLSMEVASTNLIRILQLDPQQIGARTILVALEEQLLPVPLIQETSSLEDLIAQGHTYRPELSEAASRMEASRIRSRAELWRPYLPSVHMGTSVGAFGGGVGSRIPQMAGRSDIDLLAVWSIENMGLGTKARRRKMNSQYRQNVITTNRTFDSVSAEVSNAWHTVRAQQNQLHLAEENVQRASESYDQNIKRIRGLAGLPLEGLQAFSAVADARQTYLNTIIAYNQAQLQLLRAIGRPPGLTE